MLLSIPGYITYSIFRKIAVFRRTSKSQFGFSEVFIVIIYSLISCTIYDLVIMVINVIRETNYTTTISKLINVRENGNEIYNAKELAFLCIIAIFLGFLSSVFETKKLINKIAVKLKISEYVGDTDVWTSFCANEDTKWVYVRDHKLKLIYYGYLGQYSDPGESRELLLTDVQVFLEDGDYCYDSPIMYICRQPDDITLEMPADGEGEKDGKIHDKEAL
jgi:hypothetical protein